jgi:hypothetical protein
MQIWPFPNIPPELFETLSNDERVILEALTQAYLEQIELRQRRPPVTND